MEIPDAQLADAESDLLHFMHNYTIFTKKLPDSKLEVSVRVPRDYLALSTNDFRCIIESLREVAKNLEEIVNKMITLAGVKEEKAPEKAMLVPTEEVVELARDTLMGKSRSYVQTACILATAIVLLTEGEEGPGVQKVEQRT